MSVESSFCPVKIIVEMYDLSSADMMLISRYVCNTNIVVERSGSPLHLTVIEYTKISATTNIFVDPVLDLLWQV